MTKKKYFLLKIEEGAETRWFANDQEIAEHIELAVRSITIVGTRGPLPRVTVRALDDEALTACAISVLDMR